MCVFLKKYRYLGEWAVSMTVHCESCCVLIPSIYTTTIVLLFYVLLGSLSSTSSSGLYYYGPLDQVLGVHAEQYNSEKTTTLCCVCTMCQYCVNKSAFYCCQSAFIYSCTNKVDVWEFFSLSTDHLKKMNGKIVGRFTDILGWSLSKR